MIFYNFLGVHNPYTHSYKLQAQGVRGVPGAHMRNDYIPMIDKAVDETWPTSKQADNLALANGIKLIVLIYL